MRRPGRLATAVFGLALLTGCSVLRRPATDLVRIPDKDEYGGTFTLEARVCRPAAASPAPILVLNHGAPAGGSTREDIRPPVCASPAVRWFTSRGYLVVLPMRRGYGLSGGDWAEDPGPCSSPDYGQAARAGAHDIALALAYAQAQPGVRADAPVVLGWDTGGLAALAYAGGQPPSGTSVIAMAPAGGARGGAEAGHICRPDLLVEAVGQLGATARIPILWIAAGNDGVVPPELARAMSASFGAAGTHVTLEQPNGPVAEGHDLFFANAGPVVWGPLVERFLAR